MLFLQNSSMSWWTCKCKVPMDFAVFQRNNVDSNNQTNISLCKTTFIN